MMETCAPEQLAEPRLSSERSDVWSIGAVLATMIAGRPPFSASEEPDLSKIPRRLVPVIARCLARDAAERFGTPTEIADALAR